VGTSLVIVLAPNFNFAPDIFERQEPMRVYGILGKAFVERRVLRFVGWLAWTREVDLNTFLRYILVCSMGDKFAALNSP